MNIITEQELRPSSRAPKPDFDNSGYNELQWAIRALVAGDVLDPQDIAFLQSAADNGDLSPEELELFETELF